MEKPTSELEKLKAEHANMEDWISHTLISLASWYDREEKIRALLKARKTVEKIKKGEWER